MNSIFEIATIDLKNGGRIGVCGLPGNRGDLSGDLNTLNKWRPEIVVTMTAQKELADNGSPEFGDLVRTMDIEWLHLPVKDFGGLSGANANGWPKISQRLMAMLGAGKSILVHCRGGQGRSGMIALRLLIQTGENPESALARLRAVRPGAVETSQQMAWAFGGEGCANHNQANYTMKSKCTID